MTTRTTASAQQRASQVSRRLSAECRGTALAGEPNMLPWDAALVLRLTCVCLRRSPPRYPEFERRGPYRDRYDEDPYARGPPYGRGSPPPPPRQIKQCARLRPARAQHRSMFPLFQQHYATVFRNCYSRHGHGRFISMPKPCRGAGPVCSPVQGKLCCRCL